MVRYGIRALLSEVTTIEGTSPGSSRLGVLDREADNQNQLNLPISCVRTFLVIGDPVRCDMDDLEIRKRLGFEGCFCRISSE